MHAFFLWGRVAFIEIIIRKWFLLFLIMVQGGAVIDWNLRDYFSVIPIYHQKLKGSNKIYLKNIL
jgi:hypothetical protein